MIGLGLGLSLGFGGKASGPKLPVSLPVVPLLFAGTARMAGWSGSAVKVPREATPSTPATFGWGADNRLDLAAVETYIGGQNITARVDTLFDQSGNGFDLVQPTHGARAQIRRSQIDGGALPLTCGPNIQYPIPAGLSVDRANHTVFLVFKPHLARASFYWIRLGTTLQYGTATPDLGTPGGGPRLLDSANSVTKVGSRAPKTSGVSIMGYASGAGGITWYNDRKIETVAGGLAAGTLSGGNIENGNGYSEIMAVVIFPRALTEAEMASVGRSLEAVAPIEIGQTKGVFMIGDSITAGQGCVAQYVAGLGMTATEPDQLFGALGNPMDTAVFNCGQPSIPMTALNATNDRNRIKELMDAYPEITRRVARVHAGINDLRAGSTDTTIYNAIVAYCTWLRSQDVKVIVSTINAQGIAAPYTEQAETYRLSINSQIRANWASFADDMVDYANIPELADPNNTTYFATDKLHQTAQAYQLKSALVAPKIAALLA
ncbi:SGNH/GDSL hydrolase family protein [Agrobacterium tumefaciens]|uniref:SGNH/GDSL hydrolase family protein n=1 Tax=Agrobacterium tumefaciens TaxID=358 RepID=A0A546XRX3_AGRTU|nr:SGNH/GDSL hydrolase family protein [Agrobacterium tumefaciens]TRB03498.1 SGNH/GDSL hydrolase family protein [Agrobacterium tumefaciens]